MSLSQKILVITMSLVILIFTIELIRRRRLREEYALLWILTGIVIGGFSFFPGIIYFISKLFGLHHLTTILLIIFLFLMSIVLHFSTVISKLTDRETKLVQRIAIIEWKLNQFKTANIKEKENGN